MARIAARACSLLFVAAAATAITTGAALQAQPTPNIGRLEKPFASGGRVYMSLSAGGYRIEGSADKEIRVRWETRDPDESGVRAKLDVNGKDATLRIDGPSNHFHVVVHVPERTDLVIRLSAGDLDVRRVEGSKDVDMWAGDVRIEVGEADRYRRVEASVRAGEITSSPFRINKGGLFRSFEYDGKGPYNLRVKLMAGDLKLVR